MIKCKKTISIKVIDPDSKNWVGLVIVKLETGGMMAIDESFIENTELPVYSPYDKGEEIDISEL